MGMWFRITGHLRVWICNCGYVTIIYSNVWICNYWVLKSRVWKYSQGTSVEVSTGYANTLNHKQHVERIVEVQHVKF